MTTKGKTGLRPLGGRSAQGKGAIALSAPLGWLAWCGATGLPRLVEDTQDMASGRERSSRSKSGASMVENRIEVSSVFVLTG